MLFTVDTNVLTLHTADTKAFEQRHTMYLKRCQGYIRVHFKDFTGGPAVKNPPADAGHTSLSPWSRKMPPAAGQ